MNLRHPLDNPTKESKNCIYGLRKIRKRDGNSQVARHLLRLGRCNEDYFETRRKGISKSYWKQNYNEKIAVIMKLVTVPAQKKTIRLTIIFLTRFDLGCDEIKVVAVS
jgi:hypothetical protein